MHLYEEKYKVLQLLVCFSFRYTVFFNCYSYLFMYIFLARTPTQIKKASIPKKTPTQKPEKNPRKTQQNHNKQQQHTKNSNLAYHHSYLTKKIIMCSIRLSY